MYINYNYYYVLPFQLTILGMRCSFKGILHFKECINKKICALVSNPIETEAANEGLYRYPFGIGCQVLLSN